MNTYAITFNGYTTNEVAETAGKAKYSFFLNHEIGDWLKFGEFLKNATCKLVHKFNVKDLYTNDWDSFINMREQRGIEFALLGMRVEVDGKPGIIVGSNSSLNLNVCFDGKHIKENCHPWWRVKYYDHHGNLIKEFGD